MGRGMLLLRCPAHAAYKQTWELEERGREGEGDETEEAGEAPAVSALTWKAAALAAH